MELIKELYDTDVGKPEGSYFGKNYKIRKAARALLFDENKRIAFMHVTKENYHKLPGGGVDEGEDIREALSRELYEETGCSAVIKKDLGVVLEYRNEFEQLQISYYFIAELKGEKGEPEFTDKEIEFGFELMWVKLEEAIEFLKKDAPSRYVDKYMIVRDLAAIEHAKKVLG